ncbi:MAG: 50S ribosomal protein L21e [Candidatus Methanomethylicota archaeon]|mgnify:FL=1|uniref:Large ribosomal subunit protein eL21 n=1 Tax=Thermoproteota archaeon TaxID=2056631 RepID=A0A497ET22_9CREN|nr:MAG: 50S ribosomal protein L21e [Candidatus Verstraetearchaeota archaeon]RLE51553.1 MAG: 50S ribosomal protein L21e [Candidatus Verstraetearchaeota archaeon]
MRHSVGYRTRTRKLLRKKPRERGLSPITPLLREYKPGDKVVIKIDPSQPKGMPHRRYYGKTATVIDKRGRAYILKVHMGGYEKTIIARPEHIVPLGG